MSMAIDSLLCPSVYPRLMARRWPGHVVELLNGVGLTVEDLSRLQAVTVGQQIQMLENAQKFSENPNWALELGLELGINSHGPLGFAALSAKTLADGLDVFAQFMKTRAPYVMMHCITTERELSVVFDTSIFDLNHLEIPMVEILTQVLSSYIHAVIGDSPAGMSYSFHHSGDGGYKERYAKFFKAPCSFDRENNAISLPSKYAGYEIPTHDESTFHGAIIKCREALDTLTASGDIVTRVRYLLVSHFDHVAAGQGDATLLRLEKIADTLCLTPRTLIRQLATRGLRFSDLRSGIQSDIAKKLLNDGTRNISEIADILGYGSTANFSRAFRNLTGLSPSEYKHRPASGVRNVISSLGD